MLPRRSRANSPRRDAVPAFDLASDIHVDFWSGLDVDWQEAAARSGVRVLVLAGDVHNTSAEIPGILTRARAVYDQVLLVDGNHEHYEGLPLAATCQRLAERCAAVGAVYLPAVPYVLAGGCVFTGINGWYTLEAPGIDQQRAARLWLDGNADARRIDWGTRIPRQRVVAVRKWACMQARQLHDRLVEIDRDARTAGLPIVCVSHTPPDRGGLLSREHDMAATNGAFYSSALQRIVDRPPVAIAAWVFGHTHFSYDYLAHGTRFVAAPRGGPHDGCRAQRRDYLPKTVRLAANAAA